MTCSPVFHQFARLPPEIRQQIWRELVPADIKPAVFPYKGGRPDYIDDDLGRLLKWSCLPELLRNYSIPAPLLTVNQEARKETLIWAKRQTFQLRRKANAYLRDFNSGQDALFVREEQLMKCVWEYYMLEMDPERRFGGVITSDLHHLAIPAIVLHWPEAGKELPSMLKTTLPEVSKISIVVDTPASLNKNHDMIPSTCWEIEPLPRGIYRRIPDTCDWICKPFRNTILHDFIERFIDEMSEVEGRWTKLEEVRIVKLRPRQY